MTPGLPGAGIGGLFYLLASAALGLRHVWERLRGIRPHVRSHYVLLLLAMAAGISLGVWLAGWFVGWLLTPDLLAVVQRTPGSALAGEVRVENAIRRAAVFTGVGTLAIVLTAVEAARFAALRRARKES
jgi:hypothetical protein